MYYNTVKEGLSFLKSLFIITEFVAYLLGFGLLYYVIRRQACKNICKSLGWNGLMVVSCIGTPLHELGHFLACILFRHKITSVSLFAPKKGRQTGEIGYVIHSYNKKSLYQKSGNFFIGIAPMIFGIAAILLLTQWLYPTYTASVIPKTTGTINFLFFKDIVINIVININKIFNLSNLATFQFWIYIFCIISIALNMSISLADLKNCFAGIIQLFIMAFIVIFCVAMGSSDISSFINALSMGLYYMIFGLIFGFIILIAITIISYILLFLKKAILGTFKK